MVLQEFSLAVIQNSREKLLMKKRQHGNWMCKTSGRIVLTHNASYSLSLGSRSPAWLLVIQWPQVGLWPAGKTYFNYHVHHEFKITIYTYPELKILQSCKSPVPSEVLLTFWNTEPFLMESWALLFDEAGWQRQGLIENKTFLLTAFPCGVMRRGSFKVGRCKLISACIWLHRLLLNYIGKLPTEFIIL